MSDERAHWFTAPILDPVALRAELDEVKRENRWLRGNCDADTEGVHTIITEGRYKFCAKCGETITPDKLRMAEVFAERDALKAENERLREQHDTMLGLLIEARAYVAERDELRAKVQHLRAMIDGSTATDATTKTDGNGAAPSP